MLKTSKSIPIILLSFLLFFCAHPFDALKFTPNSLPQAKVGEPYEARLFVSNNNTPIDLFYVTTKNDSFPVGLEWEFERSDGYTILKGVPETPGEFKFTLKVSCFGSQERGQKGKKEYELIISDIKNSQKE